MLYGNVVVIGTSPSFEGFIVGRWKDGSSISLFKYKMTTRKLLLYYKQTKTK